MYTAFLVVDQGRGMSISTGRRHLPFFTFHVAIDSISQRIQSCIITNFNSFLKTSTKDWPNTFLSSIIILYHSDFIFLLLQSPHMPSGFPNFRQIPSNYEVVMANRRAALQSKMDATNDVTKDSTKDATKDAVEYDAQSMASSDTLVSKSNQTKKSQGFSSGWKRMWLLSQERVVSPLIPLDWYVF